MCIIVVCDEKKPTLEFLKQCEEENPHGAGIAWREKGKIKWSKRVDLTAEEIYGMTRKIKLPFVVHTRIVSSGNKCDELCHPFPAGGSIALTGESSDGVLFHNGTWTQWHSYMLAALMKNPDAFHAEGARHDQPWSDSRAMAYLLKHNPAALDDAAKYNRIAIMYPDRIQLMGKWVQDPRGFKLSHAMGERRSNFFDECALPQSKTISDWRKGGRVNRIAESVTEDHFDVNEYLKEQGWDVD